jgi:hypothetical protein
VTSGRQEARTTIAKGVDIVRSGHHSVGRKRGAEGLTSNSLPERRRCSRDGYRCSRATIAVGAGRVNSISNSDRISIGFIRDPVSGSCSIDLTRIDLALRHASIERSRRRNRAVNHIDGIAAARVGGALRNRDRPGLCRPARQGELHYARWLRIHLRRTLCQWYVSVAFANRIMEDCARCSLSFPSFATPTTAHSHCVGPPELSGVRLRKRHIAPSRRLVVAAFTDANSLCGIIQMLCNHNEIVRHQSRYCAVARAHPRNTRPASQRCNAE